MLTILPISFSGIKNLPQTSFENNFLLKLNQKKIIKNNNVFYEDDLKNCEQS